MFRQNLLHHQPQEHKLASSHNGIKENYFLSIIIVHSDLTTYISKQQSIVSISHQILHSG